MVGLGGLGVLSWRVQGWWGGGLRGGVSRFDSIDRLPKLWLLHFP